MVVMVISMMRWWWRWSVRIVKYKSLPHCCNLYLFLYKIQCIRSFQTVTYRFNQKFKFLHLTYRIIVLIHKDCIFYIFALFFCKGLGIFL